MFSFSYKAPIIFNIWMLEWLLHHYLKLPVPQPSPSILEVSTRWFVFSVLQPACRPHYLLLQEVYSTVP